jgi:acyl-coenzyme A synthetase/AMP-(fatty) acid ligase
MTVSTSPGHDYRVVPERLNLAQNVLDDSIARGCGQRPALVGDFGIVTYEALHQRVKAVAAGMLDLGLNSGDLVLIKMSNSPEFAVAFLAAVKLGVIPVLVNSLLTAVELAAVLEQTRPQLVFTETSRSDAVRELRDSGLFKHVVCAGEAEGDEIPFASLGVNSPSAVAAADTRSDEPAFIVYTSGTTGKPKGIVHAHRWIVALGDLNRYRLPPQENDVVMATGEWSFISALGHNLLFPLRNGGAGAILAGRATPENVLAAIEKNKVTVLHCVATVYRRLLAMAEFEKEYNVKSLRCSHSTGEALREATYNEWKRRVGSELYEHYGVSEYQLVVGNGVRHPVKPGSVGKLLPGVGAAILDDDLKPVPSGGLGQFAISTSDPGLFLGYYKDPKRTEAVIRSGWYLTGDPPIRITRGISSSPAGATTASKAAAFSFRRPRSKTPCKNIPPSSKPPSFRQPMLTSATRFTRSSCWPPATHHRSNSPKPSAKAFAPKLRPTKSLITLNLPRACQRARSARFFARVWPSRRSERAPAGAAHGSGSSSLKMYLISTFRMLGIR